MIVEGIIGHEMASWVKALNINFMGNNQEVWLKDGTQVGFWTAKGLMNHSIN